MEATLDLMERSMSLSDENLVKRCLSGDKDSFGTLIERHGTRIRDLIRSMVSSSFEVEDLFQETLLQAFLGLSYLRNPASFSSWLYGIAVNLTKTWYRSRRGFLSFEEMKGGIYKEGFSLKDYYYPSPEIVYETTQLNGIVHRAIASLPEASRSAVLMHYIDGLSLQEISVLLSIPVGSIKRRLYRGREKLRKDLNRKLEMASAKTGKVEKEKKKMIPVTVKDVFYEGIKGENKHELKEFEGSNMVVVLIESSGDRYLPIFIGTPEGIQLARQLAEAEVPRPMTLDLMVKFLDLSKIKVEEVVVKALEESTYYATITVKADGGTHEVDARPSDAISLALRTQTPISVTEDVMKVAGIKEDEPEDSSQDPGSILGQELIQLEQELKRKPTVKELVDRTNIHDGQIKNLMVVQRSVNPEGEEIVVGKKEWLSVNPFFAKKTLKENLGSEKEVSGFLHVQVEGYGHLRPTAEAPPSTDDVYVGYYMVVRNNLKSGDFIHAVARPPIGGEFYSAVLRIEQVNNKPLNKAKQAD